MRLFRFSLLSFVFCLILHPFGVHAAEKITFENKSDVSIPTSDIAGLGFNFTHVAMVDLNNDSIKEIILKNVQPSGSARHTVMGISDDDFSVLGQIDAQRLMLAYDTNSGVRHILAFKDINNDFEYDVYQWDALAAIYKIAEGEIE